MIFGHYGMYQNLPKVTDIYGDVSTKAACRIFAKREENNHPNDISSQFLINSRKVRSLSSIIYA